MRFSGFLAKHSEFMKHVATLMSGKAVAGLIALITMPIVSRLFIPSDFGVAALFVSITSVIAGVASMRYEAALVLPSEDREAVALMALAYYLVCCVSVIVLLIVAVLDGGGVRLSALELLGGLKWWLPLGVLLLGAIHIQESWLTRTKSFKVASASLVVGNATTGGTRIGLGALLGSSSGGLIAGNILGMISRLGVQKTASRVGLAAIISQSSWQILTAAGRKYADFPKFNAPAGLIFSLGQNLPVLLFGVMYSPAVAGFYAMANQLVRAPVAMVANSTRRVFLQKAATIKNEGRSLQKAFLLSSGGLALLGLPALAILVTLGQPLSIWFLGERWSVAGQYLEIIAPWLFMLWVMSPCNPTFIILRKQRFWLCLQIGLTGVRLAVFGIAHIRAAGPEWTLQAFVLATIMGNLVTWATALILIRRHGVGATASP